MSEDRAVCGICDRERPREALVIRTIRPRRGNPFTLTLCRLVDADECEAVYRENLPRIQAQWEQEGER